MQGFKCLAGSVITHTPPYLEAHSITKSEAVLTSITHSIQYVQ
jgi:hypothetical protein